MDGRKDGRKDGRTESQKLCPSAFLRKGGGQQLDLKHYENTGKMVLGDNFINQRTNGPESAHLISGPGTHLNDTGPKQNEGSGNNIDLR